MSLKTLSLFALVATLNLAPLVHGKTFELKFLPQAARPSYDLAQFSDKLSYFDFVRSQVGPEMQKLAPQAIQDNQAELTAGHGVSVKLSSHNFNIHINFPNAAVGGRSYGWSQGQVGDWSDALYLDRLAAMVSKSSEKNLAKFYQVIVQMLGACKTQDLESLDDETQQVATNFLAIYTAEAYRAMVPDAHPGWDDALFEVTLLGAFHGGQTTFTKFYLGEFSTNSKVQNSGVYARTKPGPNAESAAVKAAEMKDYWQFSADPSSKQSGINLTRYDFEKMGAAITDYEKNVAHNQNLDKIFAALGPSNNVIKSISKFFNGGQSRDPADADSLAQLISEFLLDVHADADRITEWQIQN